jgi:hypothetical protein
MTTAAVLRVQLVKKLADYLDGIDVSNYRRGDVFQLPRHEAQMLIAEGWAVPVYPSSTSAVQGPTTLSDVLLAADRVERRTLEQLRRVLEQIDGRRFEHRERRREEDRIREELHDSHATTLHAKSARIVKAEP